MPTVDTAPLPSLTCPAWCTNHQRPDHPDDEIHWAEPDLPEFTALGLDPRLMIGQYVHEAGPTLMLEMLISPTEMNESPAEAAARFEGIGAAFAALAAAARRMAEASNTDEVIWG